MNAESEIIEKCVQELSEQFDSVQILCTKHEDGQTQSFCYGAGNLYARLGQVSQWVNCVSEELM